MRSFVSLFQASKRPDDEKGQQIDSSSQTDFKTLHLVNALNQGTLQESEQQQLYQCLIIDAREGVADLNAFYNQTLAQCLSSHHSPIVKDNASTILDALKYEIASVESISVYSFFQRMKKEYSVQDEECRLDFSPYANLFLANLIEEKSFFNKDDFTHRQHFYNQFVVELRDHFVKLSIESGTHKSNIKISDFYKLNVIAMLDYHPNPYVQSNKEAVIKIINDSFGLDQDVTFSQLYTKIGVADPVIEGPTILFQLVYDEVRFKECEVSTALNITDKQAQVLYNYLVKDAQKQFVENILGQGGNVGQINVSQFYKMNLITCLKEHPDPYVRSQMEFFFHNVLRISIEDVDSMTVGGFSSWMSANYNVLDEDYSFLAGNNLSTVSPTEAKAYAPVGESIRTNRTQSSSNASSGSDVSLSHEFKQRSALPAQPPVSDYMLTSPRLFAGSSVIQRPNAILPVEAPFLNNLTSVLNHYGDKSFISYSFYHIAKQLQEIQRGYEGGQPVQFAETISLVMESSQLSVDNITSGSSEQKFKTAINMLVGRFKSCGADDPSLSGQAYSYTP